MEQIAEILISALLVLILALQLAVLTYLLYMNIKRRKEEKKFYEDLGKINQKILDDLKTKPAISLKDSEKGTVDKSEKKEKTSGNRRRNQKRD